MELLAEGSWTDLESSGPVKMDWFLCDLKGYRGLTLSESDVHLVLYDEYGHFKALVPMETTPLVHPDFLQRCVGEICRWKREGFCKWCVKDKRCTISRDSLFPSVGVSDGSQTGHGGC